MPDYDVASTRISIQRDALLVDTNVLIAAFYHKEEEGRRDFANYVLKELGQQILITPAVVVEAWGWLVGSRGARHDATSMLAWLNRPGRVVYVPDRHNGISQSINLINDLALDCVDAMLAEMATHISSACALSPPLAVATFDTSDFTRMLAHDAVRLRIYDMHVLDWVDLAES